MKKIMVKSCIGTDDEGRHYQLCPYSIKLASWPTLNNWGCWNDGHDYTRVKVVPYTGIHPDCPLEDDPDCPLEDE